MEPSQAPKMVRQMVIISAAFLLASVLLTGFNAYVTFAAPNQQTSSLLDTVGFQGYLTDSNGDPVADGNYSLIFRLYDAETEGNEEWSETHSSVAVANGLYSVQLGETNALDASYFNGERWLSVQVGQDVLTPRIPISAVPFALNALGLQGVPVGTGTLADGYTLQYDATTQQWLPGSPSLPAGSIILTDGTCPPGFSEFTDARGRYVVGVPLSGTLGATVGTALSDEENRPVGQHTHTVNDPGHAHSTIKISSSESGIAYGGEKGTQSINTGTSTTGITLSNAGDVAGTNAPYIQLRFCQKDS